MNPEEFIAHGEPVAINAASSGVDAPLRVRLAPGTSFRSSAPPPTPAQAKEPHPALQDHVEGNSMSSPLTLNSTMIAKTAPRIVTPEAE